MTPEHDAQGGARGERSGPQRRVGQLVIVAVVLLGLAITATVALVPHRTVRPLPSTHLRAVHVWTAIADRCQIENDAGDTLIYSCGAYVLPHVHRTPDASSRPLVALVSDQDNCVVDELTMRPFACRQTRYEWVAIGPEVVSVAALHFSGTHYVITQEHLLTNELRTIDVPFTQWFDRSDPREVFVVEGARERAYRVGFGALEPITRP